MAALQFVHVPGYAALLLRRTYADLSLPGALMDRAGEWWHGTGAKWNDKTKTWAFPSGATITFGYLETEGDKYRYQGAEFQFVGFDELTQFSETQYRYLLSRLRRLQGSAVPVRARGASNPGGVGHEWVRQRFLVEGPSQGRPFVPARLEDNPHLDREEYEKSLAELDPVTRAQLRHGDWDVLPEGNLFKREWFAGKILSPEQVKARRFSRIVRFWDMAATEPKAGTDPDYAAGAKLGITADREFVLLDLRRTRGTPQHVERFVSVTAAEDGREVSIYMEQEPGSSGVTVIDHYRRRVLTGQAFFGIRSTGNKVERARPLSAQAEGGNLYLAEGDWNTAFLDELCPFPSDGVHDDQVDAASGALGQLVNAGPTRVETKTVRSAFSSF